MKKRRRAVHCEMIEESKTSPGYFKYQVTIAEKDGREHVVPAYGKDMQDAIERLVWNERLEKVANSKAIVPSFAILLLLIVGIFGYISTEKDDPTWVFVGFGISMLILLLTTLIDSYLNKF